MLCDCTDIVNFVFVSNHFGFVGLRLVKIGAGDLLIGPEARVFEKHFLYVPIR